MCSSAPCCRIPSASASRTHPLCSSGWTRDRAQAPIVKLIDFDNSWHDGVLHEIHLPEISGKRQKIELLVDLYPDRDPKSRRRRYRCVGKGLRRFLVNGDIDLLVKN